MIGDRPSGDEAFIPIDRSERSRQILGMAAERMGFALMGNGGMLGRPIPAGGGGVSTMVDRPLRVELGVSGNATSGVGQLVHYLVRTGQIRLAVNGQSVRAAG